MSEGGGAGISFLVDAAFKYVLHRSVLSIFATPWTVARQAALSVGILQAGILRWVTMPSSQHRDRAQVSHIAGRPFPFWATWGALFVSGANVSSLPCESVRGKEGRRGVYQVNLCRVADLSWKSLRIFFSCYVLARSLVDFESVFETKKLPAIVSGLVWNVCFSLVYFLLVFIMQNHFSNIWA